MNCKYCFTEVIEVQGVLVWFYDLSCHCNHSPDRRHHVDRAKRKP